MIFFHKLSPIRGTIRSKFYFSQSHSSDRLLFFFHLGWWPSRPIEWMQDTAVIPGFPSAVIFLIPLACLLGCILCFPDTGLDFDYVLFFFSLPGFIFLFAWSTFSSLFLRLKRWHPGRGDDNDSPWILSHVLQLDWFPSIVGSQPFSGIFAAPTS